MNVADYAQIGSTLAAFVAVFVASLTLRQSAKAFEDQTEIQAELAAHIAVQEHMKVRIENMRVRIIEEQQAELEEKLMERLEEHPEEHLEELVELAEQLGNGLGNLTPEDLHLYFAVGEHGVAMAEYIYKLVGEDDPGWRDTAKSWIDNYRAYLVGQQIACRHYHPDFVNLIEEATNIPRELFCAEDLS